MVVRGLRALAGMKVTAGSQRAPCHFSTTNAVRAPALAAPGAGANRAGTEAVPLVATKRNPARCPRVDDYSGLSMARHRAACSEYVSVPAQIDAARSDGVDPRKSISVQTSSGAGPYAVISCRSIPVGCQVAPPCRSSHDRDHHLLVVVGVTGVLESPPRTLNEFRPCPMLTVRPSWVIEILVEQHYRARN